MKRPKNIYAYRQMIIGLVKRDLRGRYKASFLGFIWTFLNPLLQLCVYTLVFTFILRPGVGSETNPYYLYLFIGLVPWAFISSSVAGGSSCVTGQAGLITKVYFPREILPISYVTSAFVNMLLSMIVVFAVIIISGNKINFIAILYLPILMLIQYILALGLAMTVSALTVYFRDLEHIVNILVMAWQFLTPILYSIELIPKRFLSIYMLNPMAPIIIAYREILFSAKQPDISNLGMAALLSMIVLILGIVVFTKLETRFAEEL